MRTSETNREEAEEPRHFQSDSLGFLKKHCWPQRLANEVPASTPLDEIEDPKVRAIAKRQREGLGIGRPRNTDWRDSCPFSPSRDPEHAELATDSLILDLVELDGDH